MLHPRDRNRLRAVARLAPPGPAVVVASRPDDDALEVAEILAQAGRQPLAVAGPFDPVALRAALARPGLRGRVHAAIGVPVALSGRPRTPAALVCLPAGGLSPASLRAFGNAWARHVRAGGYLALWAAGAPSLGALGVTPALWDAWPIGRDVRLARRKPVG
jgi:hypothetical protein